MKLPIVEYPNPILKQKCAPVEHVTAETRQLIDNMFETMYAAKGVGLAAPQVGLLQRILVIDVGQLVDGDTRPNPIALINPEFSSQEGKITWEEGCLSLPELIVPVERSAKVVVTALNPDGETIKLLGEELLAVALQHEIDHLNGILLVDRLSRLKRDLYRKKLEKRETLEESLAEPISEPATVPSGRKPYLG